VRQPQPPAFTEQVARPLLTLAAGPHGEHVVTVRVSPESLGPVTVRAHVGAEGMRVELFAPSDAGRDAIRSILPDLRRDLAGQGISASLDLSGQNNPADTARRDTQRDDPVREPVQSGAAPVADQPTIHRTPGSSLLDVLA